MILPPHGRASSAEPPRQQEGAFRLCRGSRPRLLRSACRTAPEVVRGVLTRRKRTRAFSAAAASAVRRRRPRSPGSAIAFTPRAAICARSTPRRRPRCCRDDHVGAVSASSSAIDRLPLRRTRDEPSGPRSMRAEDSERSERCYARAARTAGARRARRSTREHVVGARRPSTIRSDPRVGRRDTLAAAHGSENGTRPGEVPDVHWRGSPLRRAACDEGDVIRVDPGEHLPGYGDRADVRPRVRHNEAVARSFAPPSRGRAHR